MPKRTYLDSGVLLAAFAAQGDVGAKALEVLDDPDRQLVVSAAVKLELLPKSIYERRKEEVEFYLAVFEQVECLSWRLDTLQNAQEVAELHGIAAMDAIHVATALDAGVDELITAERPTKPMFRVTEIPIISIRQEA